MTTRQQVVAGTRAAAFDDIRELRGSFRRHLVAEARAARTIDIYLKSLNQFTEFLVERGMPTAASAIKREHVEMYLEDVLAREKSRAPPGFDSGACCSSGDGAKARATSPRVR
jgi:hypothetical protein